MESSNKNVNLDFKILDLERQHRLSLSDDTVLYPTSCSRFQDVFNPKVLFLKLSKYAIVRAVTFEKGSKDSISDFGRFVIFGGLSPTNMTQLVEGSFETDDRDEAFMLKHGIGGRRFACRYLKIVPLQVYDSSTAVHCPIISVELIGIDDWEIVKTAMDTVEKYKSDQSVKLCMKFLRNMNFNDSLHALQAESNMQIEHPSLGTLFMLVDNGQHAEAESFIEEASRDGLFNNYLSSLPYQPSWINLEVNKPKPGMRGGHHMCVDVNTSLIYLHGGWDGYQDINDMWTFDIEKQIWNMLTSDTRIEGGPGPRSCHKMCIDYEKKEIYVLGRYLDLKSRDPENLKSDLYVYHIETNKWTLISADTYADGGPQLIYDHQMCIDIEKRYLYVFGGRILTADMEHETATSPPSEDSEKAPEAEVDNVLYSGMYRYDIDNNVWIQLCKDVAAKDPKPIPAVMSRIGHSMVFHPITNKLYIFAGHRNKTYLNDFFAYDINTQTFEFISDGCLKFCNNFPATGFTQRATIDVALNEIYVLTGFNKERLDNSLHNTFWSYSISRDEWRCLYTSLRVSNTFWSRDQYVEPCPRFAHQLVYDPVHKQHILFGGNPGILRLPRIRLDDLWRLSFNRPTQEDLLKQIQLLIRKSKFQEMVHMNKSQALTYLQHYVSGLVPANNENELNKLAKLVEVIFHKCKYDNETDCIHEVRMNLFDNLSKFFPEEMAQPRSTISDAIQL